MAKKGETKFTRELQEKYLDSLRATGLKARSAIAVGVSNAAMKRFRNDNPDFDDEVEEAMCEYRDSVEAEIHRRAVDGVNSPVFYKGELVNTQKQYSDRLLEMHAKRHIPAYRDKHTVDHNVNGGVLIVPGMSKTSEDWEDEGGDDNG